MAVSMISRNMRKLGHTSALDFLEGEFAAKCIKMMRHHGHGHGHGHGHRAWRRTQFQRWIDNNNLHAQTLTDEPSRAAPIHALLHNIVSKWKLVITLIDIAKIFAETMTVVKMCYRYLSSAKCSSFDSSGLVVMVLHMHLCISCKCHGKAKN